MLGKKLATRSIRNWICLRSTSSRFTSKIDGTVIGSTARSAQDPETLKQYIRTRFKQEGLPDAERLITIIGKCENGRWNAKAVNTNKDGSKDLGIAQINDKWHKAKFTKMYGSWELIYDPFKNIDYAIEIRKSWGNFSAWSCDRKV